MLGQVDLEKLLDVESPGNKGLPLVVLDCSRPYHINNIESDRVRLLHDSTDLPDTSRLPVGGFEVCRECDCFAADPWPGSVDSSFYGAGRNLYVHAVLRIRTDSYTSTRKATAVSPPRMSGET